MAIPREEGLVRQYTVSFPQDTEAGTTQTVYFTADGTPSSLDYTGEVTDQGAAIFVQNPSTSAFQAEIYTTMKFYDHTYPVKLGEFSINSNDDAAFGIGYGMSRRQLRVQLTNDSSLENAANLVVAIVPANG